MDDRSLRSFTWIHESEFQDFHDSDDSNKYNDSNSLDYSKNSNSTDSFMSFRNLKTVIDQSKYVAYNNTIMCNQDLKLYLVSI